jgi:hypothetical protein
MRVRTLRRLVVWLSSGTGLTVAHWLGFIDGLALFGAYLLLFLIWTYADQARTERFNSTLCIVFGRTAPRKRKPPHDRDVGRGPRAVA